MIESKRDVARRPFLMRLGLAVAALGASGATMARGQSNTGANARFQPALHPQDDWFDKVRGRHRLVFDTTTPAGAGAALAYAGNYFAANKSAYNLEPGDLALVIVLRHFSTPFAFNDAVWAKYGPALSDLLMFADPKTKQPLNFNIYNSPAYGLSLPNFGTTLDSLIQRGTQFAVCDMATHFIAGLLAEKTKANPDAIYRELTANVIANSHFVPAGIVAVNRAQEHGYSLASVG
jgi:hypothetical protein